MNQARRKTTTGRVAQPPPGPLRAWRVACDDVVGITFATARSAAKFNMLNSAREAGYYQRGRSFPSVLQAWRAPEYDAAPVRENCGRRCWDEEWLRRV